MSIYVIRFQSTYKIGFSGDLVRRVGSFLSLLPPGVKFVGHMPGDRDVERHLHHRFAGSTSRGEWFNETPEMLAFCSLMLIREMPKPATAPVEGRIADEASSWQEISDRLREEAARRWPTLNHSQRKALLAEILAWRPRRVKSLYENERTLALRVSELETLNELIFGQAEALRSAAQQIESEDEDDAG